MASPLVQCATYQSCAGTVDVDTCQALTVCILARVVCKSLFRVAGCGNIHDRNTVVLRLGSVEAAPHRRAQALISIVNAFCLRASAHSYGDESCQRLKSVL